MTLCTTLTPTPTATRTVTPTKSLTPSYTPVPSQTRTPSRTPSITISPSVSSASSLNQFFSKQDNNNSAPPFNGSFTQSGACGGISALNTFYTTATSVANIAVNDIIYTTAAGTTVWVGSNFYFGIHNPGSFTPTHVMRVNNSGQVLSISACLAQPSPTPTPSPTDTSPSGNALNLSYSSVSATDACNQFPTTYFSPCSSFGNGCTIFTNSSMNKHAPAGFYADGTSAGSKTATGTINLTTLCLAF
jgi:hypothetical protein